MSGNCNILKKAITDTFNSLVGGLLETVMLFVCAFIIADFSNTVQPQNIAERGMRMYKKFEEMRQLRGLSVYAIAKSCGIPLSTLYEWRTRCQTDPDAKLSATNAARVAKCLDVDVSWLIE